MCGEVGGCDKDSAPLEPGFYWFGHRHPTAAEPRGAAGRRRSQFLHNFYATNRTAAANAASERERQ